MKIISLTYEDKAHNWRLEKTEFGNLTLLVGASGVGKTQILNTINKLKRIASGIETYRGIKWNIQFTTISNDTYSWEGEFESNGKLDYYTDDNTGENRNEASIINETLELNGKQIIKRDKEKILFKEKETPKLANHRSVLYLLQEEELIKPCFHGFDNLLFSDYTVRRIPFFIFNNEIVQELLRTKRTIESIREFKEDIIMKLILVYNNLPEDFNYIKQRYIDIFPQVEDIKIEPDVSGNSFLKDYPLIQIKERGIDSWIIESNISSGMFRSLIQISEMYLCREGSVFLIDEFENSLGVNCIDELTNDILSSKRQIQFIITSHHPYIINSINHKHWKLVTRNKGVVKTQNLEKFHIGESKHDAFMQLIQLEEFNTGIEV